MYILSGAIEIWHRFFIISFIHPIICVFFFAHTGDFNPIKSKKWVVRRSRLPELQTRGIVKSLSPSESLVWWKKPTSWAFCATVKSRSLSSIRITSSSNMHPQTWTKCSSSIQVYLHNSIRAIQIWRHHFSLLFWSLP